MDDDGFAQRVLDRHGVVLPAFDTTEADDAPHWEPLRPTPVIGGTGQTPRHCFPLPRGSAVDALRVTGSVSALIEVELGGATVLTARKACRAGQCPWVWEWRRSDGGPLTAPLFTSLASGCVTVMPLHWSGPQAFGVAVSTADGLEPPSLFPMLTRAPERGCDRLLAYVAPGKGCFVVSD